MSRRAIPGLDAGSRQRGIVMWVALIVLIVMTLAGLAIMRQMGSGVSIAGNVAFKQNATSAADAGTEVARTWYRAQTAPNAFDVDVPAQGFYATWDATTDPTQFNWNGGSVPVAIDAALGNTAQYVVHRLCQNTGPSTAPTQTCSDLERENPNRGGASYGAPVDPPTFRPYFRVTTRVTGPRNTISYIQVILN